MAISVRSIHDLDDFEFEQLRPAERREMMNNRLHIRKAAREYQDRYLTVCRMIRWCNINCVNFFYVRYKDKDMSEWTIYFLEPKDAVHFKLVWAGAPEESL